MWKFFILNDKNYIIKFVYTTDKLKFYLYDFKDVWNEEISLEEFISRIKTCNPLIEVDADEYLNLFQSLFNSKNVVWEISESVLNSNQLIISSCLDELSGFLFKFKIDFTLKETETFCKEIFIPILLSLNKLEGKQKELCELLVKKDAEILEYKLTLGSEITREYKKTVPFDETSLNDKRNDLHCRISEEPKEYFDLLSRNFQLDLSDYKRNDAIETTNVEKKKVFKANKKFCVGLNYNALKNKTENVSQIKEEIKSEPESQN